MKTRERILRWPLDKSKWTSFNVPWFILSIEMQD
jgi:hypothetical protein